MQKAKIFVLFMFWFLGVSIFQVFCDAEIERNPNGDDFNSELFYRLHVRDFKGDPVPGAMARIRSFHVGEEIFKLPRTQYYQTDERGQLKVSLPLEIFEECIGEKVMPSGIKISMSVSPPRQKIKKLGKTHILLSQGEEISITLPKITKMEFRFLDQNGKGVQISNFKDLSTLRLIKEDNYTSGLPIYRQKSIFLRSEIINLETLSVRSVPVPGKYIAFFKNSYYLAKNLTPGMESSLVTWESVAPEQQKRATYQGRVLDTHTSEPIAGAYVILAPWGWVSRINWEETLSLWDSALTNGLLSEIPLQNKKDLKSSKIIEAYSIGRTNNKGEYIFQEPIDPERDYWDIHVWSPDYLEAGASHKQITQKRKRYQGVYLIPDLPLIPKAYLKGKLLPPDVLPESYVRIGVERDFQKSVLDLGKFDFESPKNWKIDPSSQYQDKERTWLLATYGASFRLDEEFTLEVPAEATFSLKIRDFDDPVIKGVNWENLGPIQKGKVLETKPKEVELNKPYLLKVLKPDGTPAPGVTIEFYGQKSQVTDSAGSVIVWTSGNYSRATLNSWEKGNEIMKRTKIVVPGGGALPSVTITLNKGDNILRIGRGFVLW